MHVLQWLQLLYELLTKIAGAYSTYSHLAKAKVWSTNVWEEEEENKEVLCITIKTKTNEKLTG